MQTQRRSDNSLKAGEPNNYLARRTPGYLPESFKWPYIFTWAQVIVSEAERERFSSLRNCDAHSLETEGRGGEGTSPFPAFVLANPPVLLQSPRLLLLLKLMAPVGKKIRIWLISSLSG